MHAPENRLQTLVDKPLFQEVEKSLDDFGLILRCHGGVGLVPAPENAQALELRSLQVKILLGVCPAGAADRDGRHLQFLATQLFVDFDLDWQAVAIPTRHVRGIKASHGLRLDHEVFQAFVERMAKVERSIGVGRAVVQNIAGCIPAHLTDLLIDPFLLPGSQSPRLPLGQIGLHREFSMGQIEGRLEVGRIRHYVSNGKVNENSIVTLRQKLAICLPRGQKRCLILFNGFSSGPFSTFPERDNPGDSRP